MEIKQELYNHHSHIRVNAPAIVVIDGLNYKVYNWSIEGFQISGFKQKAKVGDCLPIYFHLSFKEGINISTNTLVEILEVSTIEGRLDARFLNLTKLEKELLQQAIDNLLNGEITPIEATTNGSGIPGEVVPGSIQTSQGSSKLLKRLNLKLALYSSLYLVIGGTLGFYTLRALYGSLSQMQIKTAVVTKSVEPIISTSWGTLSQVYVQEGMKVEAGQPLFRINDEEIARSVFENEVRNADALKRDELGNIAALHRKAIENIDELTQKTELGRIELAEAQAALQKANSLKQQEMEKLEPYKAIAQNKLSSARARVEALTVQYQAEKKKRDRFLALLQSGAVSNQSFDAISAKFAGLEGELREAKAELQIAEAAMNSVQKGNFYTGDNLVGELPRLTVDAQDARKRVQLAERKISALQQALQKQKQDLQAFQKQKHNLQILATQKPNLNSSQSSLGKVTEQNMPAVVYRAPFSGSVIKIVKSIGNTVKRSEILMLFQSELAEPTVEAYLTQDQAAQVPIGSQVTVLIPELDKNYQGRVIKVDRSGGFFDEVRRQYQLQGSKDQSAYVKLVLSGVNPKEKSQLTTGMPVVLNITRKIKILDHLSF